MSLIYEARNPAGRTEEWYVQGGEIYRVRTAVAGQPAFYKLVGSVKSEDYNPTSHIESVASIVKDKLQDITDKIENGDLLLVKVASQRANDPRKGYDVIGQVVAKRPLSVTRLPGDLQ